MVIYQIVLVDNKFDKWLRDDENHPFTMPLIKKVRATKIIVNGKIKCRKSLKKLFNIDVK